MGEPGTDIRLKDLYFVCDEPTCDLAKGSLGLTAEQIRARVQALQLDDPDEDAGDDEPIDDSDADDSDADPADPTRIDPLGEGAPCPVCRACDPPRDGKLLAVPDGGSFKRLLAARLGSFGLLHWLGITSDSETGTNRLLDAQRNVVGDPATSKATKSFVVGRKAITAVVLKEMPFDGHMLRYGNQDAKVWEKGEVPQPKGKGTKKAMTWVTATAKYGIDHAPPTAAARANPVYVRELQEDLFWLGYLSRRGSPTAGRFDHHTLGAVLGFKQDLADVYGIATSPTPQPVLPGSVRAATFSTAIWSQPHFISPVRIILDWNRALSKGKRPPLRVAQAVAKFAKRMSKAKTLKTFQPALTGLTDRIDVLDAFASSWPHLAALEDVTRPFLPFAPRAATKTVEQLAPLPAGKQPKHANFATLVKDPVWEGGEFEARSINRADFIPALKTASQRLTMTLASIEDTRDLLPKIAAPASLVGDWETARPRLKLALTRLEKVLRLVQFWILDAPVQIAAWLEHIVVMGTVDQATAVYLKALREGGKIGPNQRLGYQLERLTLKDEFGDKDTSATFLRDECTSRTANKPAAKCTTMPEIYALQFFGNESGLQFTHALGEFCTRPEDQGARLVKLGIDTNAHRRAVFDAVYHRGGVWLWSRGWGVGQATDVDITLDGVELRRGLPIMPPAADTVRHPRAYVDRFDSVRDAMDRKVLPRYNLSKRRDCSFPNAQGHYYDCHTCLERFTTARLTGTTPYGREGIFVPRGEKTAGNIGKAAGFFVDLERYTAFSRAKDQVPDPAAVALYRDYFGVTPPAAEPLVVKVLQALDEGGSLVGAVQVIAKEAKDAGDPPVDTDALLGAVEAHMDARSQLPCSWMHVRIRYAGTGEQAFQALHTMLHVIGELSATNKTVNKHIKEASDLRKKA